MKMKMKDWRKMKMKRYKIEWWAIFLTFIVIIAFIYNIFFLPYLKVEAVTIGSRATEVHRTNLYVNDAAVTSTNPIPVQENQSGGTSEYAIKRTNISNGSSVNLAFGFTARHVFVYSSNSNDQEIAIDWLGGTAVAPAANTAGDFTLPIGAHMTKSNFSTTSISMIAAGAGNQTVYVNAWR